MRAEIINKEKLTVAFQNTNNLAGDLTIHLNKAEKHRLAHAPWHILYPYKPDVQFAIIYNNDNLYLQFDVKENIVQAAHGKTNQPVHQDSCVEFFFSFDDGETYYNFEFNCIGTVLAGYGNRPEDREWLPKTALNEIMCLSTIRKGQGYHFVNWQIIISIPFATFLYHPLTSLKGKQCSANFYKCGDYLPEPHYLCWSNIRSSKPNFHLPEFFGTLLFQ